MKKRIRQVSSAKQPAPINTTRGVAPTLEEIRQRAYEIFLARGGAPGYELDDWLLAEQELERERTRTDPQAQANEPREDL